MTKRPLLIALVVRKALLLLIFLLSSAVVHSQQAGESDASFGIPGAGYDRGVYYGSTIFATAVQPDGKFIIGGSFSTYNSVGRRNIIRLNDDGSYDNTFNIGSGADANVNVIALQADGKIIIGGSFNAYNGTTRWRIARLNADGTLDTNFNPGSGVNNTVNSIVVQPDGKIIIAGDFTFYNGTACNNIIRLNADGSVDSNFTTGTGANSIINKLVLQPSDGKIVIGGNFTAYNGTARNHIARLNADGSLDTSFNPGSGANNNISAVTLQTDGKIIVGGSFNSFNGTSINYLARLNADGSIDTNFNTGTGPSGTVSAIAVQTDGKIIAGGFFASFNGTSHRGIIRLNANGSIVAGANNGSGLAISGVVRALSLSGSGKVLIGGSFSGYNGTVCNNICLLTTTDAYDTGFDSGSGINTQGTLRATAVQGDGKILIGGDFYTYNGYARRHIARLNGDGSFESGFNSGVGTNTGIDAIAIQPDNKIIIGGDFTTYNGTTLNRIARLNADGSLDTSFDPGSGADNAVSAIAMQPDGKIIIAGSFTSFNGTICNRIARLNADGSLDSGFNPGTSFNNSINALLLQADGKIVAGGAFTNYNGTGRGYFVRLNANGSSDTGFNTGTGANSNVIALALQDDDKIIIAGYFGSFNGTSRSRIARINTDGTLDASFDPGTNAFAGGNVFSTIVQPNGKIVIGGSFTNVSGTSRNRIARLNADGSLDTSFNPGTGLNSHINAMAAQTDGNIIIGGYFNNYNGSSQFSIARVLSAPVISWTGAVSSVWNTAGNWSGGVVPTADDNVLIPDGVANMPQVSASSTCNNLKINSGASLSINSGGNLQIYGLVENGGTVNASAGTVTFASPFGDQQVPGLNYNNLVISGNGTSKTLTNNTTIGGTLTFMGGVLDGNGYTLTLNGAMSGETTTTYFKGNLVKTIFISGAGNHNFGNIGLNFDNEGLGNWGDVTVTRTTGSYITNAQDATKKSILRRWNIHPAVQAGTQANLTLEWLSTEDNGLTFQNGEGQIWKSTNNGQSWSAADILRAISYNGDRRSMTVETSTFSLWTVSDQNNPLPVTWLYFNGKAVKTSNQLSWATATERNSSHFVIERSPDGRKFEAVGEVKAAGNSNQQIIYTFLDENATVLSAKTVYYRLKQLDLDGSFNYSSIIAVNRNNEAFAISVYPNPFQNMLTLTLGAGNAKIELTTLGGKTVLRKDIKVDRNNQKYEFMVPSELRPGMYLLKVEQQDKLTVLKVTKQ